jgi:hypothetical protein
MHAKNRTIPGFAKGFIKFHNMIFPAAAGIAMIIQMVQDKVA